MRAKWSRSTSDRPRPISTERKRSDLVDPSDFLLRERYTTITPPVCSSSRSPTRQREGLGDPQAGADQHLGQRPVDARARVQVDAGSRAGAGTRARCAPAAAAGTRNAGLAAISPSSTAAFRHTTSVPRLLLIVFGASSSASIASTHSSISSRTCSTSSRPSGTRLQARHEAQAAVYAHTLARCLPPGMACGGSSQRGQNCSEGLLRVANLTALLLLGQPPASVACGLLARKAALARKGAIGASDRTAPSGARGGLVRVDAAAAPISARLRSSCSWSMDRLVELLGGVLAAEPSRALTAGRVAPADLPAALCVAVAHRLVSLASEHWHAGCSEKCSFLSVTQIRTLPHDGDG